MGRLMASTRGRGWGDKHFVIIERIHFKKRTFKLSFPVYNCICLLSWSWERCESSELRRIHSHCLRLKKGLSIWFAFFPWQTFVTHLALFQAYSVSWPKPRVPDSHLVLIWGWQRNKGSTMSLESLFKWFIIFTIEAYVPLFLHKHITSQLLLSCHTFLFDAKEPDLLMSVKVHHNPAIFLFGFVLTR